MTYKGYELREEMYKPPCGPAVPSIGVYAGDKRMAPVIGLALAKRIVDMETESGRWPNLEGEKKA